MRFKIGDTFGRLTIVEVLPDHRYRCRCECGNMWEGERSSLRDGNTTSCGCWQKESKIKHGGYGTPAYHSWSNMKQRCTNPKNSNFKDYGGRGITVCERWMKFENFLADMGPRPEGMTLDRIDVDGNYEPGNCRWATRKEQSANQRPHGAKHARALLDKFESAAALLRVGRAGDALALIETMLTKTDCHSDPQPEPREHRA